MTEGICEKCQKEVDLLIPIGKRKVCLGCFIALGIALGGDPRFKKALESIPKEKLEREISSKFPCYFCREKATTLAQFEDGSLKYLCNSCYELLEKDPEGFQKKLKDLKPSFSIVYRAGKKKPLIIFEGFKKDGISKGIEITKEEFKNGLEFDEESKEFFDLEKLKERGIDVENPTKKDPTSDSELQGLVKEIKELEARIANIKKENSNEEEKE